LLLFVLKYKF